MLVTPIYNDIVNNTGYGVINDNENVNIDATYNWWGSVSGPGGVGSGTGDDVSENVVYHPWLESVPPSVSVDSHSVSGSDVNVQFSRGDVGVGIDYYEFRVDSNNWENVDDNSIDNYEFTGLADGDRTLQVKAIDYSGNENTDNVTVTIDTGDGGDGGGGEINYSPTADFSYSPSSPTIEDTIQFTDESSDSDGSIVKYSWTVVDDPTGEVSLSESNTSTPVFSAPSVDENSEVNVSLTVSDDDNVEDTDSVNVMVETVSPGPSSEEFENMSSENATEVVQDMISQEEHSDVDEIFKSLSDDSLSKIWNSLSESEQDDLRPYLSSDVKESLELEAEEGSRGL